MKILITGAKGQLGLTLQDILSDHELILTDQEELDITNGPAVMTFVEENKPEIIINAAAYTAVDKAEEEVELAKKINVDGAKNLAAAAKDFDALFVHISTDFVFDGRKSTPYTEADQPKPLSIYGQTKYDGELAVEATMQSESRPEGIGNIGGKYFIFRTAWLYSPYGKNFVKTIAKLGKEKEELRVVNDQIGCPTYTYDLANVIKTFLNKKDYGLYHYAGAGQCSWWQFATEIVRLSGGTARVLPQLSADYAASRGDAITATRPAYSVLNCSKIQKLGIELVPWRESLKKCIEILRENKEI